MKEFATIVGEFVLGTLTCTALLSGTIYFIVSIVCKIKGKGKKE